MRIHFLYHFPLKGVTYAEKWSEQKGCNVSRSFLYKNDFKLPEFHEFDLLIILGGVMSVNEEKQFPWLIDEKRFVCNAIKEEKKILGICFGGQLLADVLGAKVKKHKHSEIGWHEIRLTKEADDSDAFCKLPSGFISFEWHQDTFEIPSSCIKLAESDACENQAFEYNSRILGLQFHPEFSFENISRLLNDYSDLHVEGKYVQSAEEILRKKDLVSDSNNILKIILENLV